MADLYRILSSPVRLSGELRVAQLAAMVSVDAMCRRARAKGLETQWMPLTLAGDLAGQHVTERELARAGLDRATVGREAFVERVREREAAARTRLADAVAALGVDADFEAGTIAGEASARAAVTAFVRLFEQGRLQQMERVVDTCARCATVVHEIDAEAGQLELECPVVDVPVDGQSGVLTLVVDAPELLPGAVAVLVPEGHAAAGRSAALPLVGRDVPVREDTGVEEPVLLVPAHHGGHLERARELGLAPLLVLDGEGVVEVEGPLAGLSRYAARAAAGKLLADEGVVTGTVARTEAVRRCRRCGAVLVPRLGRHWFLSMADLELAAADAVRDAPVTFSTRAARDELMERAGAGGDWCLSHQVWAGQPVPVARCLDCGQVAVTLHGDLSCGKCMGMLAADDSVLDARFVGTVAMLAAAGWPDDERAAAALAPATTLVVGPAGVSRWALPLAALGVRLAGTTVFEHVAVQDAPDGDVTTAELQEHLERDGAMVVRLALLAGGLDVDAARELARLIEQPPVGEGTIDDLWPAFEKAFDAGVPAHALSVLGSVLSAGIRPQDTPLVRALAAPLLGVDA